MSTFLASNGTNNGFGGPMQEDHGYGQPGPWHFESTGTDSTRFQQRSYTGIASSRMGNHVSETTYMHICSSPKSMQSPEIIASASEQALDQNVFYARIKLIASQQKIELDGLQKLAASQQKELEELRLLNTAYKYVTPLSSSDTHG